MSLKSRTTLSDIRFPSELTWLEWLSLIKLSYSRISDYDMCQAKYFYNNIIDEPGLFNPPAVMGTIVHSVMEDYVGEELDEQAMQTSFDEHRKEHDPTYEIPQDLIDVGHRIIADFYDRHKDDTFDVIAKEMPFEIIIGTGYLRGYIDLVLRMPNGDIKAIDIKAGKHEIDYQDVSSNLQLGIYALALQKMYPDKHISVEMYYLRSGRRKGHTFTDDELVQIKHNLHEKIYEIVERINFNYTQDTKVCKFLCDFGKTGVCSRGSTVIRKEQEKENNKNPGPKKSRDKGVS